jgi:hypothetical protein
MIIPFYCKKQNQNIVEKHPLWIRIVSKKINAKRCASMWNVLFLSTTALRHSPLALVLPPIGSPLLNEV